MDESRWLSAEEQDAWREFLTLHARLQHELNARLRRDAKLSLPEYEVLVHLSEAGCGLRGFALAELLGWERSRLSHQLTRMVERGLVARKACPEDGRGAIVSLTAEGRKVIEAAAPQHVSHVRELLVDGLSPEELSQLGELSRRGLARIEAAAGSPATCDQG